ncbi:uncharacterized protein LOC134820176 [Bolinopsis microptera]|uniref:uncharacterized protein LOC134820176 n=1 Tax=Bolinopsis microptera TaxID=2820187 RepID=UPI00307AD4C1
MRDLYQPKMLENWIVKRVSGPISDAEVPALSSEESVVLTLTSTPSPLLAAASLKLTRIMFHHQSGEVEYQGRVLLEGGTYVIRNFLGETSVESVDLAGSEEEVVARIRALTHPTIQHVATRVFTEIYYNEQWMLGLLVQGAVSDHKAIFDMFISTLEGLKEMLPDPAVNTKSCSKHSINRVKGSVLVKQQKGENRG